MNDADKKTSEKSKTKHEGSLFQMASIVYGVMATLGILVSYFWHATFPKIFFFDSNLMLVLRYLGIGALSAGLLLILSYYFELWFSSFKLLKWTVMKLLGPCSLFMVFYLSAISALGEELLFRGAIQPFAGLLATSIIFGLLHIGPDGRISAWSLWAFIAGLLLGWMYDETKSLWPPIFAHFVVNSVSIYSIRRKYLKVGVPEDETASFWDFFGTENSEKDSEDDN